VNWSLRFDDSAGGLTLNFTAVTFHQLDLLDYYSVLSTQNLEDLPADSLVVSGDDLDDVVASDLLGHCVLS
jgi:hypothetical protein